MKKIIYTITCCLFVLTINAQVLDSSFGANGKKILPAYSEFEEVSSALLQPDGKILIGGYDYDETFYYPSISVWRVNKNGSIDKNFGSDGHVRISGSPFGGSEYGGYLALQPDNKIIGAGTDFDRDGEVRDHIILFRLKTNGEFDSTFGTNGKVFTTFGGVYNVAAAVAIKNDGKILVTGQLDANYKGTDEVELVQYLPNGKLDSSFGTNGVAKSGLTVKRQGVALIVLPDNKTIAGFLFTQSGISKTCLIRYNANGTVDSSFGNRGVSINKDVPANSNAKMSLAVQANGKIVVYQTTATNTVNSLSRFNIDGGLDNSFGVNGHVTVTGSYFVSLSVVIDDAQRLLVNTTDFSASRYLSNGQLDLSFGVNGKLTTGFTAGSFAKSEQLLIQPDSKIIFTGLVDSEDGLQEFALARFKNASLAKAANSTAKYPVTIYPNPVNNMLSIKQLDVTAKYILTITDAMGNIKAVKQIDNTSTLNWNIADFKTGLYHLNVVSGTQKSALQFFKQ